MTLDEPKTCTECEKRCTNDDNYDLCTECCESTGHDDDREMSCSLCGSELAEYYVCQAEWAAESLKDGS